MAKIHMIQAVQNDDETCVTGQWELLELFERQAQRNAGAVAIAAPGRPPLTYGGLRLHLEGIERDLRVFGIRRGDCVAVVVPNGPEMAMAFAAVASFAICAPLNPAYRFEEFDFYLADLRADALIIQSGTCAAAIAAAQKNGIPIFELIPLADSPAGIFSLKAVNSVASRERRDVTRGEEHALVLHTSGTTSRPKLVALTRAQLLIAAANVAACLQLTGRDRCLNIMPLFHIHGLVGALLASLTVGGSVICTAGFDGNQFFDWLKDHHPTWFTAVPTMHQAILAAAKRHTSTTEQHSLRFIRSCSAALRPAVARELEALFGVPVIEAYGMTEAAHQIASNPLPPRERKPGSVGLPTGTEVAVIDRGRFAACGEVGEIAIRGRTVICAYANSAASHDESFTDGWLRTGDQGFLDKDGYLCLTGRSKEVINRGGEKISPGEIEEVLLDHPEIVQAVIFRLPHASLGDDVGAAVVLRPSSDLAEFSIRNYLLDRIAAFKVPAAVFIVKEIPKGATGKVSRAKLSEQFAPHAGELGREAGNHLEKTLAGIYQEVLGAQRVGAADNFFALGGDSLRATQVINRVRALLKVNLSIATIFRKPTVTDLADEIARNLDGRDPDSSL